MAVKIQQIITVALILIASVLVPALSKGFDANGEKDDGKREYLCILNKEIRIFVFFLSKISIKYVRICICVGPM